MPGSWCPTEFPNLRPDNHAVTSNATRQYNCLAWAAYADTVRWEPDPHFQYYWPPGVARAYTVEAFVKAYESLGFRLCYGGEWTEGIEKMALYAEERNGVLRPTHAALQLEPGKWTSKIGDFEDISHTTEHDVAGGLYGRVRYYLERPRPIVPHPSARLQPIP